MKNIKLAELKLILDNKVEQLKDIYAKRSQSLIDTYRQDKDTKELEKQNVDYEFSVDELTKQADILEKEILKLRSLLTKANCVTETNFVIDGEKLSLHEAIVHIKSLRGSLDKIKYLGELKEERKNIDDRMSLNGTVKGYVEISKPTFNTKVFRERYEKMNKLIQKLEVEISTCNYTTDVAVPDWINLD